MDLLICQGSAGVFGVSSKSSLKTATTTWGSQLIYGWHKLTEQIDNISQVGRGWLAGLTCQDRHPTLGLIPLLILHEWTLTAMLHTVWAFQTWVYLSPGPSAFTGVTALEKVIEVLVGNSPNLSHLLLRLFLYMSLNVTTLKGGANFSCILMRTLEFRDISNVFPETLVWTDMAWNSSCFCFDPLSLVLLFLQDHVVPEAREIRL